MRGCGMRSGSAKRVEHRQHAAARAAADHGNAADSPKLFIVYEMKKMSLPSNKYFSRFFNGESDFREDKFSVFL